MRPLDNIPNPLSTSDIDLASSKQRMRVGEIVSLLRELGKPISRIAVHKHIKTAGLAAAADHTYDTASVLEAIRENQTRDNRLQAHHGLKAKKCMLECQILETKRDQLRGLLIPYDEHITELREIAAMVNSGLEEWVSYVSAIMRNKRLVGEAERIRDRTRSRLVELAES